MPSCPGTPRRNDPCSIRNGTNRRTQPEATETPNAMPDPAGVARAQLYAEELGLDLASGRERDLFLWFLASLLFGQRISEAIARNTYHSFVRHGLTSPRKILAVGLGVSGEPGHARGRLCAL